MATLAVGVLAAGASAAVASSSAKKQQGMVKDQIKEARRIRAENTKIANESFADINKLIDSVGSISSFLSEGKRISDEQRADRLSYVLGDAEDDVRGALGLNAQLANFDFAGINSRISDILKSNTFDIAAITKDMPTGSFANLSVSNIANLAQQGVANTIGIGEFISKVSGIDQFNPYRIAQDLFTVERDKAGQKIQNTANRAANITGINNQWFNNFSSLSSASMAIEANKAASYISSIGTAATAISRGVENYQTQKVQDAQIGLMNSQMNYYNRL